MKLSLKDFAWRPIHTAPLGGQFVELRGDSGYIGTPYRIMIARYESSREQDIDEGFPFDMSAWRNHCGDQLTDDGAFPTHWRPLTTELIQVESEDVLDPNRGDGRKAHYGSEKQPWDTMKEPRLMWAPHFAAGSILKYLRRDKRLAHSLESARVYHAWLLEGARAEIDAQFSGPWMTTLWQLENELTDAELGRLRAG